MPTPPLTDAQCIDAIQAAERHRNSHIRAAEELGINVYKFRHWIKVGKQRGLHLSDGARGAMQNAGLSGVEIKGGWIHSYDDEGKKTGTNRWTADQIAEDAETVAEKIRAALEGMTPAPVVPSPEYTDDALLTIYPIADAHIGMMAWGRETGEDYNSTIAVDRLKTWVGRCVASSPASHTAIILDVGDLLHADDHTNQTPGSKHVLDVDTRYYRTIEMTIAAMASAVNSALVKHERVIVRILPGNHDKTAYIAVLFALAERYRENPRVEVQKAPGEFFAHEFGKVMIAAHHGDKAKAQRMVLDMADAHHEMWGRTRHRFLWTGHMHHHKSEDIGGVQWEQLRALTARDAYAASHSYSARAQLQAVTYHRDLGEVSRVKVGAF